MKRIILILLIILICFCFFTGCSTVRDTIEKILDTGQVIKEFKANQIKPVDVFKHLKAIIDSIEKILEKGG